ncbi:MAG: glycosyltransferase family 2 protein [Patescibacteria group bacterium]|nr:glycosyltransferase family 2 protein [Patescibacteria group bacterium]
MDYLKIGKASELSGRDRKLYRVLEILPGFLSLFTLFILVIFSYFYPTLVAFFLIAFDVYWLLLVVFLAIHLIGAYLKLKKTMRINWRDKLFNLKPQKLKIKQFNDNDREKISDMSWKDIIHLVIFPTYNESLELMIPSFEAIINSGYPLDKIIMVLAIEERAGQDAVAKAKVIEKKFGNRFKNFLVTIHPDNIAGELKGKGANQAWAARQVKEKIIDAEKLDYDKILASVFDIDTVIGRDYFYILTYKFLTTDYPHRASYQPIPVYHNNIWQAPFFARVAAASNTFWQMMQQIRQEKLATYSSHSMAWRTLSEVGFWSTSMVSEDSRIFWHSFIYYNGDYRVCPLHYSVSMDACMDSGVVATAKNLYKQQRRWGWGVENVPYLIFNTIKRWKKIPKQKFLNRIFAQIYGFHSWATNALIIAVIGWLPMILGGDRFNVTVLSTNLPFVTRTLMTLAMFGLVLSAILSTLLLPAKPKKYSITKYSTMLAQWIILPFSIIFFGAIPGLDAQIRLMFKKYLGFWITPKSR